MRLYSVQFPAVLVAIDLNSWEMELSWFKYSAPSSSLLMAFGPRLGLGLQVIFLQDVREAFGPQIYQDMLTGITVVQT